MGGRGKRPSLPGCLDTLGEGTGVGRNARHAARNAAFHSIDYYLILVA